MSQTTATNDDHGAKKTPIAATATTARGADENDDGPNYEHKYVNIETDKKIPHSGDTNSLDRCG